VAAAAELGWPSALWWRMRRHGLVERDPAGADALVGVASRLCGLHAQVMSSAELTAWARIDGLRDGDVASALWDHGRLVKTWAMRGTLHLLPGDELPLWHAAFSMYEHFLKGAWVRAFGFSSADEVEALIAEIGEALDGRALTREELAEALPHHGDKLRESWGSALKPAAFRGLLAFAPSEGQSVRFTRPPAGRRPPADEAVRAITRRYLAAYAPARREDMSRWWGTHALSAAKAQKRIEALGDEVVEVDVEGSRCWVLADDLDAMLAAKPPGVARLLPLFDQYVVNSNRDIEPLLAAAEKARVFRQAGWISPVVLVDGAIAGVWKHERRGAAVEVALEPLAKLPRWAVDQVEADAARLADHLGGDPRISWT
jgi:Winged helix DNA-binding domain